MPEPHRIDNKYRRTARIKGGTRVRIRLIGPADRESLIAGFERLSPESRYRRFFVPVSRLKDDVVDRLLDTDNVDHLALGAECLGANGQVVGPLVAVARYVRLHDNPEVAEAAVTVGDDLQHMGLGRLMLSILVQAASERDIRRFRAHVLPDNTAVLGMLNTLDVPVRRAEQDQMLMYEFDLPSEAPRNIRHDPMYEILRASARRVRRTIDMASHLPWIRKHVHLIDELNDELSTLAKGRALDISQHPVDTGDDDETPGAPEPTDK